MAIKTSRLIGDSEGFDGETIFTLMDGTKYKQIEYYYHYRYEYMPVVTIVDDQSLTLNDIDKTIKVSKI